MVRKEFTFRGKTLKELVALSEQEFSSLLCTRQRRTFRRGYTETAKKTLLKLRDAKKVKTHSREIIIMPWMVGKTVSVHKGNSFVDVILTEDMLGHRVGEFAFSKKKVAHGKAGLGASSGSSATTRK